MTKHRSVVYVYPIGRKQYGRSSSKDRAKDSISKQFRFLVRLAVACNEKHVPYNVEWNLAGGYMTGTITASGNIPIPSALPKEKIVRVSTWSPKWTEAEYTLSAYREHANVPWSPGFVIKHSSGLQLVCPTCTGEWGTTDGDADPNSSTWKVVQWTSGLGMGYSLALPKATKLLLMCAESGIDFHADIAQSDQYEHSKLQYSIDSTFATGFKKRRAIDQLKNLRPAE